MRYKDEIMTGFWIDWDGKLRSLEAPGDGYTCKVCERASGDLGIDVIGVGGFVEFEADYHGTLHDLWVAIRCCERPSVFAAFSAAHDFDDALGAICRPTYAEVHISPNDRQILFTDGRDFLLVASVLIGSAYTSIKDAANRLNRLVSGREAMNVEVSQQ